MHPKPPTCRDPRDYTNPLKVLLDILKEKNNPTKIKKKIKKKVIY